MLVLTVDGEIDEDGEEEVGLVFDSEVGANFFITTI